MLDKKIYIKYIKSRDEIIAYKYMLKIILLAIILFILLYKYTKVTTTTGIIVEIIIGILSGIIIFYPSYISDKIKVEEMKLKYDIWEKITKEDK